MRILLARKLSLCSSGGLRKRQNREAGVNPAQSHALLSLVSDSSSRENESQPLFCMEWEGEMRSVGSQEPGDLPDGNAHNPSRKRSELPGHRGPQ
jgi:hypothetical protein